MNKLRFLILSFFLVSLFVLVVPQDVHAQAVPTIGANLNAYVAPTGSECNINVPSQYSTIQAGVDAANSGDTVCVASGTYNENVVVNKAITLAGRGANQSIINGLNQNYDIYGASTLVIANASGSSIVVEGFRIIGGGTTSIDSSVLLPGNSPGATIQYNWVVSGNNGFALNVPYIRNNDVIQNNILEGNNSNQVVFISHNGPSENEQILNNTFIGTVATTNVSDSGTIFTFGGRDSIIKQNAFDTTGSVLIVLAVNFTPNIVTENNFNSIADRRLGLSGGNNVTLSAENNWYGTSTPTAAESGIADIVGFIDYTPFATSPFPEYPLPSPNASPIVGIITASTNPVQVNTSVTASASFTDQDSSDTHTASWNWGDENTTIGNIIESNGSGTVTGNHSYASPGTYIVTLTVSDGTNSVSVTTNITILTPVQAINNIIDTVQTFNLQQGISNSLDTKLSNALDSLNDLNNHNDAAAINSLQAFINAVNAQRGNKITNEQADTLISQANTLIAYLSP